MYENYSKHGILSGGARSGGRYNDNRGGFSGNDRYAAPGKDRYDSGDRFQNRRGGGSDRGGRGRPYNDRAGGSRTPQDRGGGRGGRFNSNSRNDYQAPVQNRQESNEEEENWDDDVAGAVPSRPTTQAPPQQFNSSNARNDYLASKNRSNDDDEENWDDDLLPMKSPTVHSVSTPKTNTSPKSMTMSGDQTPLWDEE